jgi:acetyltransferase EpsM
MNRNKNILIWGGGLRCLKIINYLNNPSSLNMKFSKLKKKIILKYIFDTFVKKPEFDTRAKFFNNVKDLKKIIFNSYYFIVAIGSEHGKARYLISKELEKKGLFPLSTVSKHAIIDPTAIIGKGVQIEPGAIIQGNTIVADYCIINTNATIEHGTKMGMGCHVMTGATIAGKVNLGNFVTIGTNATILPYINIDMGTLIGAGSVVTRNIKKNKVVAGNPAKFFKTNKHKCDLSPFKS